uniref:Uncharacterized protein n=1 Tax=Cucumis melo TaxID=3656 RepID=A0A9I9CD39_CUCME
MRVAASWSDDERRWRWLGFDGRRRRDGLRLADGGCGERPARLRTPTEMEIGAEDGDGEDGDGGGDKKRTPEKEKTTGAGGAVEKKEEAKVKKENRGGERETEEEGELSAAGGWKRIGNGWLRRTSVCGRR